MSAYIFLTVRQPKTLQDLLNMHATRSQSYTL